MNSIFLFRNDLDTEEEFNICKKYVNTVEYRSQIPDNSCIWGRYSFLPFYEELEKELKLKNSYLINSYEQHRYIADIENYYSDIKDYTPKTYFMWSGLKEGKYVVKGKTNSRKHQWNRKMFAENLKDLSDVISRLMDDSFISDQRLCVREYIPLKEYGKGINGLPFTNEWRFFFYKDNLIDYGYYWSHFDGEKPKFIESEGKKLAIHVSNIVKEFVDFFVIDVAQTKDGDWIVIELNDASMSGLSDINLENFYSNISKIC